MKITKITKIAYMLRVRLAIEIMMRLTKNFKYVICVVMTIVDFYF